jgi:L-asparaginase/Glu-tRNA(Gln) amidotransferase subunit D
LGHLPISDPQDDSVENTVLRLMLEDHCANDGVVVVVAQTIEGPINMNVYAKGREQQAMGIIGHGSLCPPTSALVKLHHLLSRGEGRDGVAAGWVEDLCGENPDDARE